MFQKRSEPFDMSLPAVSKHLAVLEKAGLISRSREAQAKHLHDLQKGTTHD